MALLKQGDTDSPLDQLLAEICRRGWRLVLTRNGTGAITASITRGVTAIATVTDANPSKAMQSAARSAIDRRDAEIEKLRNG